MKNDPVSESIRDLPDQIVALLSDESRDDRDNRSLNFLGQSETSQQIDLALTLSRQILD